MVTANDYYPFGMIMPGRSLITDIDYRYSINGQEKTPEIAPNTTTAPYWEYDSRIVRRWNIDPKQKVYESPYMCFSGSPILLSDPMGDQAGDPQPKLYHNTEVGKDVFTKGFNASTHGKYSNYNWFSTTENAAGTGRTGVGVSLGVEGVNVKNATVITTAQTTALELEAIKQLGYADKKAFNAAEKTLGKEAFSKLHQQMRGIQNSKLGALLNKMGQSSYYIESTKSYAVTDAVANAGTIKTISGSSTVVKALNGLKWGGKVLVVVAAAKDIYDIYNSGFEPRTIVKKAGFWAGVWAGGATASAAYTATGLDATGPWGWVGHGATTILGGIIGGIVGEKTTETVYDYITRPGAKPGMQ
ncbi:MAG: hypothetical protein BGO29_11595 [Bacteroidales bacterium 36-12]|nr:MAG: hypothetical protein BGO29_11595 [Bacteroidales bacterium 36-12]